jgi:hypothetical protein
MPLLTSFTLETGVCDQLPRKLAFASTAIQAFMECLPSRCLAGLICVIIILIDENLK